MTSERFPDFYLVGAPKCGTTAMYDYLASHPDLFLPSQKELLFFGSDLSYANRPTEAQYLANFTGHGSEARVGTAHTAYLQSRRAASEIRTARPDADIIVMLRNPVDMLHSWHSELLYEAVEDIEDFERALDAEPARRRGDLLPPHIGNSYVESLYYLDVASFADQVERYIEAFGNDHVRVILHDDLSRDPAAVYRDTLGFLGVSDDHVPGFDVRNANKRVRSTLVQQVFFHTVGPVRTVARAVLPRRVRRRLIAMNTVVEPREPMKPEVRERIRASLGDDVERLGQIIGRDLGGWLTDDAVTPST